MADMDYRRFISFNVIGGFLWAAGMSLAGYFLGSLIPDVDKYLLPIVGGIIVLSVLPGVIHIVKDKKVVIPSAVSPKADGVEESSKA